MQSAWKEIVIIKQTITFDDGKTIEVFYEKKGQNCKLYSTADINKYGVTDLYRIMSTNFEKADHVEGKCYASRTVNALIAMTRGWNYRFRRVPGLSLRKGISLHLLFVLLPLHPVYSHDGSLLLLQV